MSDIYVSSIKSFNVHIQILITLIKAARLVRRSRKCGTWPLFTCGSRKNAGY